MAAPDSTSKLDLLQRRSRVAELLDDAPAGDAETRPAPAEPAPEPTPPPKKRRARKGRTQTRHRSRERPAEGEPEVRPGRYAGQVLKLLSFDGPLAIRDELDLLATGLAVRHRDGTLNMTAVAVGRLLPALADDELAYAASCEYQRAVRRADTEGGEDGRYAGQQSVSFNFKVPEEAHGQLKLQRARLRKERADRSVSFTSLVLGRLLPVVTDQAAALDAARSFRRALRRVDAV